MESKLKARRSRRPLFGRPVVFIAASLFLLLALLFPLAGVGRAQTNINEFVIGSTSYAQPEGITYGSDGRYWFVESSANRIGAIDTVSNVIQEVLLTNVGAYPLQIVSAPDGNLWFTEYDGNQIGKLTPGSTNYSAFLLPTNANPGDIAVGPDGNIWFVEYNRSRIAAIAINTPTNVNGVVPLLHEYGPFNTNSQISGLTAGPDGNLWFTEGTYGAIGNVNPATGVSNTFLLPSGTNSGPLAIVTGPDGNLWFTENATNRIGSITPSGSIKEYVLPLNGNYPYPRPLGIISNVDGNLWFTEYQGSAIGKITTNGIVTLFPTPTAPSFPTYLATGSGPGADSNIWFGEFVYGSVGAAYDRLGRLNLAQAMDLQTPTAIYTNLNYFRATNSYTATFKNSRLYNNVVITWGDGTSFTVAFNLLTNTFATYGVTNGSTYLLISNATPVAVTNFTDFTYTLTFAHYYGQYPAQPFTVSVTDDIGNLTAASISFVVDPFFNGQSYYNNLNYLVFPDNVIFGYFSVLYFPYLFHYDLGFEYVIDAHDGQGGVYWFDFKSNNTFFYTSPSLFPYLYDFTLNSWLYYYPNPNYPGRYTSNPRYFYDFATSQIITK